MHLRMCPIPGVLSIKLDLIAHSAFNKPFGVVKANTTNGLWCKRHLLRVLPTTLSAFSLPNIPKCPRPTQPLPDDYM